MSDVEGVTAEETTAPESVENETPKEVVKDQPEVDTEEEEQPSPQEEGMSDEELEKVKQDPKVKAFLEKEKAEAIKAKESNRKMALKHKDETILKLKERVAELQGKEVKPLDRSEFDTEEEYENAKLDQVVEKSTDKRELQKAQAELNAEMKAQISIAKESFEQKLAEIKVNEPDVDKNLGVVAEYLDMLPQNDPGVQSFRKYIAMETDLGPALANHLGKHPEIIEDQLIGKPWPIVKKKLQAIEKELSAPKEQPPAPEPLPKPLSKTKGAATATKPVEKMSPDELLRSIRK